MSEYMLRHLAEHLYLAGDCPQLYNLTSERDWLNMQTTFDASRQTYAESLDWALQAAEVDPNGLPTLLVLSVLRPTVNVLAAQIPMAALEVLAQLGDVQQAEAYAQLHSDLPIQCEALCRIAEIKYKGGDKAGAQETLSRARRVALAITDQTSRVKALCHVALILGHSGNELGARELVNQTERMALSVADQPSRTYLLAHIATVAQEVGASGTQKRATEAVRDVFERDQSNAAVIARKLHFLNRPDYLLALAEWEQKKEVDTSKNDAVATIARIAAEKRDYTLLDEILAQAQHEIETLWGWQAEAIVAALTEAGRPDDALVLVETWCRHHDSDDVDLREAMARAAGKHANLKIIERVTSPVYVRSITGSSGDKLDWEKRLAHVAESASHSLKRTGWRMAGMGDWEKLRVLLAGIEGLKEEYPEQARSLWERAKAETGWLGRQLAPLVELFLFSHVDQSEQAFSGRNVPPVETGGWVGVLLLKWLEFTAHWGDDETGIELMAMFGRFDQAVATIEKTDYFFDDSQSSALASVAHIALEMGDIAQTIAIAERIDKSKARKQVLEAAAEALAKMPHEQAVALLNPFVAQANRLGQEATLVHSPALSALMRETARFSSVRNALGMIQQFDLNVTLTTLPDLCKITAIQKDFEAAQLLLAIAEKIDEGKETAKTLAEMSAQWAEASAREQNSAQAKQWKELASQAFRLAKAQAFRLTKPRRNRPRLEYEQAWLLPSLALAARYLKHESALRTLQKRIKELAKTDFRIHQAVTDQVLIQVALGLTKSTNYLGAPLVEDIWHREYRAQVWAEMSAVLSSLPPQKKLFWTCRDQETLQFEAKLLLDNAKKELMPFPSYYTLPTFKPSQAITMKKERSLSGIKGQISRHLVNTSSERSLFAKIETVPGTFRLKDYEVQSLIKSGRNALDQSFEVFIRDGRQDDVMSIATNTPPPYDQPVIASAVKVLAQAGQIELARSLFNNLTSESDTILALAGLVKGLAVSDVNEAESLLSQLLLVIWKSAYPLVMLEATSDAATNLPLSVRLRVVQEVLRTARERGRADALTAIAALASLIATLMNATEWRKTVNTMIETETWWSTAIS